MTQRENEAWHTEGACHGATLLMFSEERHCEEAAKLLCKSCPVKVLCLAASLERQEPWGTWGGYTRRERKALVIRLRLRLAGVLPDVA